MHDLAVKLAQEHLRLQQLIEASIQCLAQNDIQCEAGRCPLQNECRQNIRTKLHAYLSLSIIHFNHEHEDMRQKRTPKSVFEAHALAHSELTEQINQVIANLEKISEGELIQQIRELGQALQHHIQTFD